MAAHAPPPVAREADLRALLGRFASAGDLCFDVGAHAGSRARALLALGARVVAVEPQPRLAAALRRSFAHEPAVTVLQAALGPAEGWAEMMVSRADDTISTLDPEWAARMVASGRFDPASWNERARVRVTTLDALVAEHGLPAFIKVDVEGWEPRVLRGLSRPVPALSLEFHPEELDAAFACVDHLRSLGPVRLNYSLGESMRLALPGWVGAEEIRPILRALPAHAGLYGDVYVRSGEAP